MDFSFSEEQEMLRTQVRAFLQKEFPEARVVEVAGSAERDLSSTGWAEVAALGLVGLSAPEASGGSGMSFLDEVVVIEEMGAALYPGPYMSSVLLAQPALEKNGSILQEVAGGSRAATLAWHEDGAPRSLLHDAWSTSADGSRLTGTKRLVIDGDLADTIVVVAGSGSGLGLWAVDRGAATVTPAATMDTTRRYAHVSFDGAEATALATGEEARSIVRRIWLRLLAGLAVEATGIAQRVLDLSQQHVKEREQFGRPIGSYQAVSHQVADTYMGVELARSLAYWAAWCVAESDPQAESAASAAKSFAAEAAVSACERAIQVHGGIGFTWEHILHRYYKRAQWIDSIEGFGRTHRARIADELLAV